MEKILVNVLTAAALLAMDRVHRQTTRGILLSSEETCKVVSCRRFLQWQETRMLGGVS